MAHQYFCTREKELKNIFSGIWLMNFSNIIIMTLVFGIFMKFNSKYLLKIKINLIFTDLYI